MCACPYVGGPTRTHRIAYLDQRGVELCDDDNDDDDDGDWQPDTVDQPLPVVADGVCVCVHMSGRQTETIFIFVIGGVLYFESELCLRVGVSAA